LHNYFNLSLHDQKAEDDTTKNIPFEIAITWADRPTFTSTYAIAKA
jgi:hypothetical protein